MSRGSLFYQENAYPINDPRYGMTPEQVRVYNLNKEAQEAERRRIQEDILANPFEQEDAPVVLTPQEEKELKNLERSGFLEEGDYQERVEGFKEGDKPFEQPSHEEIQTMKSDEYRTNILALNPDYVTATDLNSAKKLADSYYIEHLTKELANDTTAEQKEQIQKLIDKGAPSFDNIEDYQRYEDLNNTVNRLGEEGFVSFNTTEEATEWQNKAKETSLSPEQFVNRVELDALDYQKKVMGDYILTYEPEKADKNVLGRDLSNEENPLGITKTYSVNTGTAFNSPLEYQRIDGVPTVDEEAQISGFGEYQLIGFEQARPDAPSWLNTTFDILSVVYPPMAPVLQGSKAMFNGAEFEDALKIGGSIYLGDKITNISDTNITKAFDKAGIDITALPDPVQNVILDTTGAVLEGKSGTEAIESGIREETVGYIAPDVEDAIKGIVPDINLPDFETPEFVKEAGDVVVDILEQPLEFVGDTFESLIGGVETVTAPIEDLSTPLKEAIETVGEPIVDVVDEVIDAVDSPIGDILETAVGSLGGTGGMMSGARKPSQVEGLFDKELFKFDTEIKSTQRMLSPTNTRRYG